MRYNNKFRSVKDRMLHKNKIQSWNDSLTSFYSLNRFNCMKGGLEFGYTFNHGFGQYFLDGVGMTIMMIKNKIESKVVEDNE